MKLPALLCVILLPLVSMAQSYITPDGPVIDMGNGAWSTPKGLVLRLPDGGFLTPDGPVVPMPSSRAASPSRSGQGHIKRSSAAKNEFKKTQPCPATGSSSGACPGWTVDHVVPLKRGGPDVPANMQWQIKDDAKAKDRWE